MHPVLNFKLQCSKSPKNLNVIAEAISMVENMAVFKDDNTDENLKRYKVVVLMMDNE